MTFSEAKKILDEFGQVVLPAVQQYVKGYGLSSEAMVEFQKRGGDLTIIEEELRNHGKDPISPCVVVFLRPNLSKLPPGACLPGNFKGLNIYILPALPPSTARPAYP